MQLATVASLRLSRAHAIALSGVLAGVGGELLFRGAALGLNFSLFVLLVAILHATFAEAGREHGSPRRTVAAALLPLLASAPIVLLDSQWSRFFAVPTTLAWLVLVPRFVEHGLSLRVFGRVPKRIAEALVCLAPALSSTLDVTFGSLGRATRTEAAKPRRTLFYGLVLGVPSALVFTALFSFDAKFSRALVGAGRRSDDAVAFAVSALGLAILVVLLISLEEVRRRRAHKHDHHAHHEGPLRGTEDAELRYRAPPSNDLDEVSLTPSIRLAQARRFEIPPVAWALVLLQVSAVFALYVSLHMSELWAGHVHVRTTHGVTYAGQLHEGFFSLLVATGLAMGLVSIGHTVFDKARAAGGLSMRQGRVLAMSEVVLLMLTVPTLASCTQKLVLYVEAYGHTYLRAGVALAIAITFPLLLLTAYKSLRPTWNGFGGAAALVLLVGTSGAAFFDADAHVARVNVLRGLEGDDRSAPFDPGYIAALGDRALVGLASARPEVGSDAERRWAELVRPIAGAVASRQGVNRSFRGFRMSTPCDAVLPAALCVAPATRGFFDDNASDLDSAD